MGAGRLTRSIVLICLLLATSTMSRQAAASAFVHHYSADSQFERPYEDSGLMLWPGAVDFLAPAQWYEGEIFLGRFNRTPLFSKAYHSGTDVTYNNVPFTFTLKPRLDLPLSPQGYKYDYAVTGPAADGAVIKGYLNGTFWANGVSDVVATFDPVTPNSMALIFRDDIRLPYTVDPSLPNPFPISQLVLPESVLLNWSGETNINVRLVPNPVPEPTSLLIFMPLAIVLAYRNWPRS